MRANFFLARSFANLEHLNRQLRAWLDTIANVRLHGSTGRVLAEHFATERVSLTALPAGRFDAVLRAERRVSHEGMVSVGGSVYSVPDCTVKRVLEAETTSDAFASTTAHRLVAVHALLHGRPALASAGASTAAALECGARGREADAGTAARSQRGSPRA